MKTVALLFVMTLFALGACSNRTKAPSGDYFSVYVDAINDPTTHGKFIYYLHQTTENQNSLQNREYERYVDRALEAQGFVRTYNLNQAEIMIFMGYGIGDPETVTYNYDVPIFGQTGYSSSTTTGSINRYGGSTDFSATTRNNPQYGIVGSQTRTYSQTFYTRYFFLDAIDIDKSRAANSEHQIWKTSITSRGYSDDLRRVFPVMVAASKPYLGKNTQNKIKVTLGEYDPRIKEIKNPQP